MKSPSPLEQAFSQYPQTYDVEFPRGVIEEVLEEKEQAVGGSLSDPLLDDLSPEDRRLLESRVIGGMYARLALATEALKEIGVVRESFLDLDDAHQEEVRHRLGESYIARAGSVLAYTNGEVGRLLEDSIEAERADPLPFIPHSFVRHHVAQTKRLELTDNDRARSILAYMNVRTGTFPPDGLTDRTIGTNDSILVQAFGRNSIPDKELPEVSRLHMTSDHDNDTFEQLRIDGFDPGEANRALAKVIVRRHLKGEKVVEPIMQWEVAYALWELDPVAYSVYSQYIHTVWPTSGFYPTYEVKADSIKTMDALGLYNPKEFAHQDMAVRALGILAKQGVEADLLVGTIPFDRKSIQAQVRGPGPWMVRESLTRVEHVLRGRV